MRQNLTLIAPGPDFAAPAVLPELPVRSEAPLAPPSLGAAAKELDGPLAGTKEIVVNLSNGYKFRGAEYGNTMLIGTLTQGRTRATFSGILDPKIREAVRAEFISQMEATWTAMAKGVLPDRQHLDDSSVYTAQMHTPDLATFTTVAATLGVLAVEAAQWYRLFFGGAH